MNRIMGLAIFLTSCGPSIREEATYRSELALYDSWATQQASILRKMVGIHCPCEKGGFTTLLCSDAGDYVLTIEARHKWHMQMTYYIAGLSEKRPPQSPPIIPKLTCPLMEVSQ